ncbi:MAG: HigA family addiction module antitoxin [Nitrosospira sp.]|nr:HigA family addiction module antidote protein [Nitrosospira sp.]
MARTPIHPGVILGDELAEIGMSAAALARTLRVPTNRITQIIKGQRAVTADTAVRLSKWLGTSPNFWLNLQQSYELRLAEKQLVNEIKNIPCRTRDAHQAVQ